MTPPKRPYLHVREVDGSLFPFAIAVTGNARALLQLRRQIDRALAGVDEYPADEEIYLELGGEEFEVIVKWARSPEEMRPPAPEAKLAELAEESLSWVERARGSREDEEERR